MTHPQRQTRHPMPGAPHDPQNSLPGGSLPIVGTFPHSRHSGLSEALRLFPDAEATHRLSLSPKGGAIMSEDPETTDDLAFLRKAAPRAALTAVALHEAVEAVWGRDPLQLPPVIWSGMFSQMHIEMAKLRPEEKKDE